MTVLTSGPNYKKLKNDQNRAATHKTSDQATKKIASFAQETVFHSTLDPQDTTQ